MGTDAVDSDASAILKWVRAGGRTGVHRRELQKAQEGRFRSVDRLQRPWERLEQQDVLRGFNHTTRALTRLMMLRVNPKSAVYI